MSVLLSDHETYTAHCNGCRDTLTIIITDDEPWDDQEYAALTDAGWEQRDLGYFCPDCLPDAPESFLENVDRRVDEVMA
jgi:hypothetical protein